MGTGPVGDGRGANGGGWGQAPGECGEAREVGTGPVRDVRTINATETKSGASRGLGGHGSMGNHVHSAYVILRVEQKQIA